MARATELNLGSLYEHTKKLEELANNLDAAPCLEEVPGSGHFHDMINTNAQNVRMLHNQLRYLIEATKTGLEQFYQVQITMETEETQRL